jgi:hypothetical protein
MSSPPDPVDDTNIFSIIDDDEAIETEETMVCGDDLPMYTSSIEYVDQDVPIMFTREQYLFHVLNTITYKTKVDDQAKWIRQANVFVDMLFDPDKCIDNIQIRPIVLGHRYRIITEEQFTDNDLIEELKEENYAVTTMTRLLNRRFVNKNTASYSEYIKHMHKVEQTFTAINKDDHVTAQYTVPYKSNCYVFQGLQETVDGGENGNHVVFGKSSIYDGDVISILGFVYKGIVDNSDKKSFEWIDAEDYRSKLETLEKGTKVDIYPHMALGMTSGEVKDVDGSKCDIKILNSGKIIVIDTKQIWKNNEFVFAESNKRRFAMSDIVQKGVAFSLLSGDEQGGKLTVKAFVPSPSIIAIHNANRIGDIPSLKHVLHAHGYLPWHYQHVAQNILSDLMTISIQPGKSNIREALQFPSFAAIDSFGKMPDYQKYEFDQYRFEKGFADTEFHRMMYLFHQGDAGFIHMLELLTLNLKSTKTRVNKHIELLGPLEIEEEYVPSGDDPCTSRARIYKKEYNSIEALRSDNNKILTGVVDGDYAKLVEGDRVRDYRRYSGVWIKHDSNMLRTCNNLDVYPVTYSELIKLDCIYDDLKKACSSMQIMKDTVKRNNKIDTMIMLQNTQDFRQRIDDYLVNVEDLKKEVADMLRLYRVLGVNAIENNITDRITFQVPQHDYGNHIGNANAFDFEAMFGNIDFSEQGVYSVEQPDTTELVLPGDSDDTHAHIKHKSLINAISNATGIMFSNLMLNYLIKQSASTTRELLDDQAIEQRVSDKKIVLENNFRKTVRQMFQNKYSRDPTVDEINKQKKIFDQKLVPLLQNFKEKLISQTKDSDKVVLFNACGMIAVFAKINRGDIRHINPSCRNRFSEGMVVYMSCVIQKMASNRDDNFQPAANMTFNQIESLMNVTVSRILAENENLRTAFQMKSNIIETSKENKIVVIDWPSFRPLIKEIHGPNIREFKAPVKGSVKRSCSLEPLKITKSTEDTASDRVLFISKRIGLPMIGKSRPFVDKQSSDEFADLLASSLPEDLKNAMRSEEWDVLIDNSQTHFRKSLENLQIKSKEVYALFSTSKPLMSQVAHSLRNFVSGELRSMLGKLKSRYKIEDPDTASEGDVKLARLIEKMEDSPGIYNQIMPKLEKSILELADVSVLNRITSTEFRMFAYLIMLINVICNLSMKNQPLVTQLVRFIIASYLESNEMNTYSPEKLKHGQEALREKSKEEIIARFEGMDEESRRAIQEMKKAGYKTLIDALIGGGEAEEAGDAQNGEGGEGGEAAEGENANEDFHPFQGDNDDAVIDPDVFDEDNNDAWMSADD